MKIALKNDHLWLISFLALLSILSAGLVIYSGKFYSSALPFVALVVYAALHDYRIVYYLLLLTLPFSMPFGIGSANIDLPTEPLMIVLLGLSMIILIRNRNIDMSFLRHPITLLLIIHFTWMIAVSMFSVNPLFSIKYLLSKAWYIAAFYFFTCLLLQKIEDFRKIFWLLFLPFLCVILYTLIRHYQLGLSFETSNIPMSPFFLNHVMYSTALVVFLPFVFSAYFNNAYNLNAFKRFWLGFGLLLFVLAIGFSYTRASWLGIPIGVMVYFIVKKNLMKISLILTFIFIVGSAVYLSKEYRYMQFAPDYQQTIYHRGDIEGHLRATYKMKDVSGMERIHRWIAAKRMFESRPFMGSGPSTFYSEYKIFTLKSFKTYVSDNPEQSSTHNYYLMVLCEQGIIGLALFLAISTYLLIIGAKLYRTLQDREYKNLAMACTISLVIFYFHLMLNDLVETDKIGSLFFISMAILVKLDLWARNHSLALNNQSQGTNKV
jgi:O-antigen ligase